ncbi:MAG: methionine biosynthesis protein MetW [Luminiphilus sp.]|nr:methionine biosynthesis protein MetW [Luminiphilus sp.]
MRYDLTQVEAWIPEGSRVLDLGCGDGAFLDRLQQTRHVRGLGLELDPLNLIAATQLGVDIVQQDMDQGLDNFPDASFDVVILAHALQVLNRPDRVLRDMVRIGREAVVTFPNFGHWRCRLHLGLHGRMPVSEVLPYSWYDTPNIHFCTVRDFEALCGTLNIDIIDRDIVSGPAMQLFKHWFPNLFGSTAIFRIRACA